jgi:hypothetical protein
VLHLPADTVGLVATRLSQRCRAAGNDATVPAVQGSWEREPHRAPRTGDCNWDLADGMLYGCAHTHIHVTQRLGQRKKERSKKLGKKMHSLPEAPFPQSEQRAVVSVVSVVVSGPGVDPGR